MADEMQQDVGFEQTDENAAEQQTEEMQQTEDGQGNGFEFEDLDDDTEDDRKLFVGGISWESDVKDLREYFEKFGKVVTCNLKKDFNTQKSRGFGFVVFALAESVEKVLNSSEPHKINQRTIDPKRATPRPKKIFVGKLDPETPETDVKEYFTKFGEVEKIDLPYDKAKEKRRAFCFVEFKKMSSFKKCLEEPSHTIKSQEVDVKKATMPQQGGGMRGGQRGRGGYGGPPGRGGRGGGYQGNYGGGQYNQYNCYPENWWGNEWSPQYNNDPYSYGNPYYWGNYGYNQGGYNNYSGYGNQPNYGKTQKRGGGQGYHPYNR